MKKIIGTVSNLNGCNVKVKYVMDFYNKKYGKRLKRFSSLMAHSDMELVVGDSVVLESCAPISKTKKYKVVSRKVAS